MVAFTSLLLTTVGQQVLAHRVFSDTDSDDIGHTGYMARIIFTTDSGLISKPIYNIFPDKESRYDDANLKLTCTARLSNFEHFASSGLSSQILSDQRVTGVAFATETDSIICSITPTGTSFFDYDYDANSTCMSQKQIDITMEFRQPESGEIGYDSLELCSVTTDGLKNFMRRVSENTSTEHDWRLEYYRTGPYTMINIGIGDDEPALADTELEKEFYRKAEVYAGSPTRSKIAKAVTKFSQSVFPVYTDTNGLKTDMGRTLYLGEFGLTNRDTITESVKIMYQGKFAANESGVLTSSHFLSMPLSNTPILFIISVESALDSSKEYYTDGSWFNPATGEVYCASTVTTGSKVVSIDYIYNSGSILDYIGSAAPKFILEYDSDINYLATLQEATVTTRAGYNSPKAMNALRIVEIIGNTEQYLNIHDAYWGFTLISNPEVEGRSNEGMSTEAIDGYGAHPSLNDLSAQKFGIFAGQRLYAMNEIDDANIRIGLGYHKTLSSRKMDLPWYAYTMGIGLFYAAGRASQYHATKDENIRKEFTNPVYQDHNLGKQTYYVFNFELPEHIKEDEIEHLVMKWSGSGVSGGEFALDWYIWYRGEIDGPPEIARGHWEQLSDMSYNSGDAAKVVRRQLVEKPVVQVKGFENLKYYVNGTGFITLLAITPNVITKDESATIDIDYVGLGIYEKSRSKPEELFKFREGIDYYYDWQRATAANEGRLYITWPGCRVGSELSTTVEDLSGKTRTIKQNYPVQITNKFQEILNQNTPGIGEQTEFLLGFNWTFAGFDVDHILVTLDQKDANYGIPAHTGADAKTTLKRARTFDVSSGEMSDSYTQEYYQVGGRRKDNTDLYLFDGDEDISFENRTIQILEFRDNIKRDPTQVSYAITYEYVQLHGQVVAGDCVIEDRWGVDLAVGGAGTGTLRIMDGGTILYESESTNTSISLFDAEANKIWESGWKIADATYESRIYSTYPVVLGLGTPSYIKMTKEDGANDATLSIASTTPYKGVDPFTNVKVEAILNLPSYYKMIYVRDDGELFCRGILEDGSTHPRVKPSEKDSVTVVVEVLVT